MRYPLDQYFLVGMKIHQMNRRKYIFEFSPPNFKTLFWLRVTGKSVYAHKVVSKLTSKLYFTNAKSGRNTALAITDTFLWISKTVIYRLRSIEFCNNKWIVSIYHKSYSVHFTSNIFEYFCSINIHFWMNWIYFKPALYITIMF